jgi:hypothetical protein
MRLWLSIVLCVVMIVPIVIVPIATVKTLRINH